MAKNITMDELLTIIDSLPYNKFKEIIDHYSATNKADFENEMELMVTASLQQKLLKLGINSTCPYCNSDRVIKNGKRKHIQVLQCKDCNKKFTPFTNTILEKTRWHWDIWIKVLEMTINNYPIQSMVNVLVDDYGCVGINYKTVWLWRMKLIHALASLPQPVLTGIIQVDETFIRESQKGSKATSNRYFKFGEEDCAKTFNKREYLLDEPKSKLYAIAKECKMKHYRQLALWSLVSEILKQPNIDEIIYKLLADDRHYKIDEEDLGAIKAGRYI